MCPKKPEFSLSVFGFCWNCLFDLYLKINIESQHFSIKLRFSIANKHLHNNKAWKWLYYVVLWCAMKNLEFVVGVSKLNWCSPDFILWSVSSWLNLIILVDSTWMFLFLNVIPPDSNHKPFENWVWLKRIQQSKNNSRSTFQDLSMTKLGRYYTLSRLRVEGLITTLIFCWIFYMFRDVSNVQCVAMSSWKMKWNLLPLVQVARKGRTWQAFLQLSKLAHIPDTLSIPGHGFFCLFACLFVCLCFFLTRETSLVGIYGNMLVARRPRQ